MRIKIVRSFFIILLALVFCAVLIPIVNNAHTSLADIQAIVNSIGQKISELAWSANKNLIQTAFADEPDYIQTHNDKIPNFCKNATKIATGGNWSSANSWSPRGVPASSDIVIIPSGVSITYDVSSGTADCIGVHGTLSVSRTQNTSLKVGNFLVYSDGRIDWGTPVSPIPTDITAEIVIANRALETGTVASPGRDPRQHGTALLAWGKVNMHGATKTSFVRLAVEPRAADTTLQLAQAVMGWKVGDRLFLPDSRQLFFNDTADQSEYSSLARVSSDGKTLTLASPLKFGHPGAHDPDGSLKFLPHVANLTRNVIVSSENPTGTRGHALLTDRADVDVRYAGFIHLGRTRMNPLDNTTFDESGRLIHIGKNQVGRYPLHLHHLIGPTTVPNNGYQSTLMGNFVGGSDQDITLFRWGITLHNTHYSLVRENVVLNMSRHGIATEDGSESENVIERNFVARIGDSDWNPDPDLDTSGASRASGIWLRGPNNYVRDNVVANVGAVGPDGGDGLTLFAKIVGEVLIPASKGAVPSILVDMNARPMLEFARNEAYSVPIGASVWGLGVLGDEVKPITGESVVKDLAVWNIYHKGFYVYESNRLTVDGMVGRNDINKLDFQAGIWGDDYLSKDFTVKNVDLQGFALGYTPPWHTKGEMTIRNSYLKNKTNIAISTLATNHVSSEFFGPRKTVISNVRFADLPGISTTNISMSFLSPEIGGGTPNYVQRDEVLVYNYNNVAGDNFRAYYKEQRHDFIVPQQKYCRPDCGIGIESGVASPGPLKAGLTNQQSSKEYVLVPDGVGGYLVKLRTAAGDSDKVGLAIGGAIAPRGAVTRAGIEGLVAPTDIQSSLDTTPPSEISNPSLPFVPTLTPEKTETQKKISELLKEIARLRALISQIQGNPYIPFDFIFGKNLRYGTVSQEVQYLQIFLNSDPDTQVARTSWGSPGKESTFFGKATRTALIKFQQKYSLVAESGYLGPSTIAIVNQLLGR